MSVRGRGSYERDRPPVLTLVRRSDGMTEFVVMKGMDSAVDEISSRIKGECIVITDNYSPYKKLEDLGINHMVIDHGEPYAIGDIHEISCENRHSFLRKFRGVSKRYLHGYISFL